MPNHITNILTIYASEERMKEVLDTIKGEEEGEKIDFNKIIPMPKEEEENWYDWSLEHWDTKWNAYNFDCYADLNVFDNAIAFDTAWSAPYAIYRRLAEMFPDISFQVRYASEDIGGYCGLLEYDKGVKTEDYCPKAYTKAAYELTFEVLPYAEDYYEYNEETGEYDYAE